VIRLLNVYFPARTVLLGVSEVALVCVAFTMAVVARFGRDADLVLEDEHGLYKIALVACIYLLSMYYLDLYDSKVLRNRHEILTRLIQVVGLGGVILAIIYYFYPDAQLGRSILILGLGLALPFLVLWREIFLWVLNSFQLCEKTAIIGHGPLALKLNREIQTRRELGLETVGYVDSSDEGSTVSGLRFIGTLDELPDLIRRYGIGLVIVAMEERRGRLSRLSEEAEAELGRAGSFEQLVGRYGSQGLAIASVLAATGRLCSLRRLASGIVVPDLSVTEGLRRRVDLLSEAAYRSRRLAFLSGLADAGLAVQGQWEGIAQEGRLLQAVLSLLGMVGRKGLGPRACAERLGVLLRGTDSSLSSVLRLSSVIRAAGSVREARQLSALKEDDLRRTEESLRQADAEAARLGADLARVSVPRCPVHGVELACPLCSRPDDSNNPL